MPLNFVKQIDVSWTEHFYLGSTVNKPRVWNSDRNTHKKHLHFKVESTTIQYTLNVAHRPCWSPEYHSIKIKSGSLMFALQASFWSLNPYLRSLWLIPCLFLFDVCKHQFIKGGGCTPRVRGILNYLPSSRGCC